MTLWIELNCQQPKQPAWKYFHRDAKSGLIQQGYSAVTEMPNAAETIAVIPAAMLAWLKVSLPANISRRNPHKLLAILKGIIEVQILDDIDDIHIAIEPAKLYQATNNEIWLGICHKPWLTSQILTLTSAKKFISKIIPQMSPTTSVAENSYWLEEQNNKMHLFSCRTEGVFNQPINSDEEISPLLDIPPNATIFATQAVAQKIKKPANFTIKVMQPELLLTRFSNQQWNFAQFELEQRKYLLYIKRSQQLLGDLFSNPQLKFLRYGLVSLLLVTILGLNSLAFYQNRQTKGLEQQISANLKAAFPGVPLTADNFATMKNQISTKRHDSGIISKQDLASLIDLLPLSLPKQVTIDSLVFANGELAVSLAGLTDAIKPSITSKLTEYGYQANFNEATLIIKANNE